MKNLEAQIPPYAPVELWVVTSSESQAVSDMVQNLTLLTRQMPFLINVVSPSAPIPAISDNTILLLCLTNNNFQESHFQQWVEWGIGRLSSDPTFRLYLFPYGFSPDVLRAQLDENPTFQKFRESVQINPITEVEVIVGQVKKYVREKNSILNAIRARKIQEKIKQIAVFYAAATEVMGGIFVIYAVVSTILKIDANPAFTLLGIGITGIFCLLNILAFRINTKLAMKHWKVFFAMNTVGLGAISLFSFWVAMDVKWILLGIALSFLSELAGRGNFNAKFLEPRAESIKDQQEQFFSLPVDEKPLHPINLPLFPEELPKIFISYSKSDGSRFANELYEKLKRHGIDSFMDRETIPGGARWRYILGEWLNDANIFFLICSPDAPTRPWVAEELGVALRRQKETGLPHIIVLMSDENQRPSNIEQGFSSFNYLFGFQRFNFTNMPRKIRFIHMNDKTLEILVQSLRPSLSRFHTDSIFSHTLVAFSRIVSVIFQSAGTFSKIIGNIGFLLFGLLSTTILANHQILRDFQWLQYISVFLIGCIFPLWLAEKFDVVPKTPIYQFSSISSDIFYLTGSLGLTLWFCVFLIANFTPFSLVLSWVLFLAGFWLEMDFKKNTFRWAPLEKTSVSA